jgi:8-oxo-dGTP pyrophosphatase MutT (NUDIX family)
MTVRHNTASAVVFDEHDRVLLVHHNKVNLYLYPGGHIDPDEDPAEAAVREVLEETGIKTIVVGEPAFTHPAVVSRPAPWAIIEMDVRDAKVGEHRHIDFVYVCRAVGGDLNAQLEEVGNARWVPVAEVADLPVPPELPALIAAAARWAEPQPSSPSFIGLAHLVSTERISWVSSTPRIKPADRLERTGLVANATGSMPT